jgi:Na+/melibiose symporter-like transporter
MITGLRDEDEIRSFDLVLPLMRLTLPAKLRLDPNQRAPGSDETPVPRLRLIAFSMVAAPTAATAMPMAVYIPAIYAQTIGVPLTTLGMLFLFGRIWDAITDPLIGSLSDRTRTRWGRRRPWMLAGGILLGLVTLLMFFPPAHVSTARLGVVLLFFYLGWTMLQIPFLAWSGELSGQYHERTRIATYQTVISSITFLLVLVVPTIMEQIRPHDGRLKLAAMGVALLLLLVLALPLTLRAVHEPPLPEQVPMRLPIGRTLALVFGDRLLLRVLASDFAVTLAQFTRGSLFVFFVTSFMGRPQLASGLFLIQYIFGILAGPIWLAIGRRIGKHRAAVAGELTQVAINLLLLLATPDRFAFVVALTISQGLAQGSGNLMLRAIVADLADKHRLETGVDRTGLLFSVFSLSGKAATAAAVGVALPLVAWFGFDPRGANGPAALNGLLLVFALGPALAHSLSALLIRGFPLDEGRHRLIRDELARVDVVGMQPDPGEPDHAKQSAA